MRNSFPGYRHYSEVLLRLAGDAFRPAGGGLNFSCPFPWHRNGDRNPSAYVKIGGRGELVCRCLGCGAGWKEFVEYVGLPAQNWWPNPMPAARPHHGGRRVRSKPVAEYPYHDYLGNLIAVKVRWEPGFDGKRKKDFSWRRPLPQPLRDKLGIPPEAFAWVKELSAGWFAPVVGRDGVYYFSPTGQQRDSDPRAVEMPATPVGPYREHEVHRAAPSRPVVVVEGEGKADLLAGLGVVATSGPAGKGKWESQWGQMFSGRQVVAVPDPDGVEWACRVLASGVGWGAESVRLASLPADVQKRGEDVKDWMLGLGLDPAGMKRALSELVKSVRPYTRG